MPNELPIPDDLNHLIEKRSGVDRRQSIDNSQASKTGQGSRSESDRRASSTQNYSPGAQAIIGDRFRCEHCLHVVQIAADHRGTLPNCGRCGNDKEAWYLKLN